MKENELLACNEELAKELFNKELQIIVTDGVMASNNNMVDSTKNTRGLSNPDNHPTNEREHT
ncbi:hypothetical protein [Sutcliffiella rhizosphaerae]|uniref:Transposase n=1 Tax=Sutcliffiella rhizosphaerae TaxID=2880967 RepID=A0ABN8A9W8_9BACI|nr:hypothetical protein [Sutcliffiella rhizosphaerae]CAG9621984.1 hypothetical protein BACCIP111883_02775 [Sutcliffiella rhizosphaerae]